MIALQYLNPPTTESTDHYQGRKCAQLNPPYSKNITSEQHLHNEQTILKILFRKDDHYHKKVF